MFKTPFKILAGVGGGRGKVRGWARALNPNNLIFHLSSHPTWGERWGSSKIFYSMVQNKVSLFFIAKGMGPSNEGQCAK